MPQANADILLEQSLCFHRRIEKAFSPSLLIAVLVVMPHRMFQMTHLAAAIQKNTFVVYLSFKAKAPTTNETHSTPQLPAASRHRPMQEEVMTMIAICINVGDTNGREDLTTESGWDSFVNVHPYDPFARNVLQS